MRYGTARSHNDQNLHVLYLDEDFDRVPQPIRNLDRWQGHSGGNFERLKFHYRLMLTAQGFAVAYGSVRAAA
jgi:hypothetical protein